MLRKFFTSQAQTNFNLYSGRILLVMFVLLVCILGLTHPLAYAPSSTSNFLQIAILGYSIIIFVLSYASPFIKNHLYYFVIVVFYFLAGDFLYQLYLTNFSINLKGSFLIFTIVTVWYFRERRDVLLYLLSLSILLVMVFFLTPNSNIHLNYLYRYAAVITFTYFFIGSRISTIQQLMDQDLQYKVLIERLNDGIVQLDTQGYIILVNEKLCKLSGYHRKDFDPGFRFRRLIPEGDREPLMAKLEDRKKGISERYEIRLLRKNGEIIWVHISSSPNYDESGKFTGATAIITNITDRKVAEEELTQYSFELARSNRELEQKNQELERFAHIASSDLKVPLQTVIKSVDTIIGYCQKKLYDHAHPYLNEVTAGCQRMNDLIDALLLYSISGNKQMNKQIVELQDVVEEVVQSLDIHIKANNVQFTYGSLPKLYADRVQLIRLFRNLIENAIKFRGQERPQIDISCNKHARRNEYIFSVTDNGIGISREYYEEVFLIFQKGDKDESPGLGLGLAICKKIIRNHGGRLWLKSTARQGTTFFFTLSAEVPEYAMLALAGE